jgi:hypothetical protein
MPLAMVSMAFDQNKSSMFLFAKGDSYHSLGQRPRISQSIKKIKAIAFSVGKRPAISTPVIASESPIL